MELNAEHEVTIGHDLVNVVKLIVVQGLCNNRRGWYVQDAKHRGYAVVLQETVLFSVKGQG